MRTRQVGTVGHPPRSPGYWPTEGFPQKGGNTPTPLRHLAHHAKSSAPFLFTKLDKLAEMQGRHLSQRERSLVGVRAGYLAGRSRPATGNLHLLPVPQSVERLVASRLHAFRVRVAREV